LRLDSGKRRPAVKQRVTISGKPNVTLPAEGADDELVRDLVAMGTTPVVDGAQGNALELLELERDTPYEIRGLSHGEQESARAEFSEGPPRPIASISVSNGLTFVSVRPPDEEQDRWVITRAECLERLASDGISVEMVQFQPQRLRFIVSEAAAMQAVASLRGAAVFWRTVPCCSKLCVVSAGIRTTAGVFYRSLMGLAQLRIPMLHFSDSNVTISLIVPEDRSGEATAFLREVFAFVNASSCTAVNFDAVRGRVRVNGHEQRLGSRQAKLLRFLLDNAGRVVEAEEVARCVFGSDGKDDVAALRVHMHNLRKKIEVDPYNPRYIVTVPGQGYLFVR